MITWSIDDRMPPLHPYPAALDDCLAVYRAVLELRARDEGLSMPAALVLPTPAIDLTESGDTFHTLDGVAGGLRSQMAVNLLYANGHDLTDSYLSPLFADLSGFPPTFLQSGTRDLLLSNTVRMHRKLLAAGIETELHIFEAMPHTGFGGTAPEDIELEAAIRTFLDKYRRAP